MGINWVGVRQGIESGRAAKQRKEDSEYRARQEARL